MRKLLSLRSNKISKNIVNDIINAEILKETDAIIEINNNLKLYSVLLFFQIKYITTKQDSPRNKGLPIVLHNKNVGVVIKASKKILFTIFLDKNNTKMGRLII